MNEEQIRKAGEILSDPRNQKQEVQALQDTMYVIGGKWRLLMAAIKVVKKLAGLQRLVWK